MVNSVDDSGRKPYCSGDRIECFSTKDITLIEMSFSKTLLITERSDIGRELLKSHLAPNLNIGITFESFNDSEKHPRLIDKSKNVDRGKKTSEATFTKKHNTYHQIQRMGYFLKKK